MKRQAHEILSKTYSHMRRRGSKHPTPIENGQAPTGEGSNTSSKDSTSNAVFCKLCANLALDSLRRDDGYLHVADIRELQDLSTRCSVCNLLKLGILETATVNSGTNEYVSSIEAALELLKPLAEKRGTILRDTCPLVLKVYSSPLGHIRVHYGTLGKHEETVDLPKVAMDLSLGQLILHRDGDMSPPPLLPRLDEEALFNRYLGRIGHDFMGHRKTDTQHTVLPSRVLDLEWGHSRSLSLEADVRLIETRGEIGEYATLSYCWGSYRGCMTEQASYKDRLECIKFADLPKVFQEAVYVTRKLRIKHLWIDSLCIIQDCDTDWQKEAAQMGDIYRNGRIRIAATVAADPTESFYPPKPIVTSVRTKHIKEYDVSTKKVQECFLTLPKFYVYDVDAARLNSRAWVLQERLLAPTTLHFCRDHIYFEQGSSIDGEDGALQTFSWSSCIERSGAGRQKLMQLRGIFSGGNYHDSSDTSDSWLRIAELYSRCHITFATDKLIAISSLMKDRQIRGSFPYLESKFFLGMWESTVHEDLLWVPEGTELKRLSSLGLPSWAWIGYEGAIVFLKDQRSLRERSTLQTAPVPELEIIHFTGPYETNQLPFSEPVSLVTRLKLCKVPNVGSRICRMERALSHEEVLPKSPFRHYKGIENKPIPLCSRNDCFEILDENKELVGLFSLDTTDVPPEAQLWCAHVATIHDESYRGSNPLSRLGYGWRVDQIAAISGIGVGPDYEETPESHILAYCLILTSTGAEGDQYQRIGMAEVKYEWISQALDSIISML